MPRQSLPFAFIAILVLTVGCEYRKHDTPTATLKGDNPPAPIPRQSRTPIGNAILIYGTNVLPIYAVSATSTTARAVGFTPINGGVRAVNEKGQTLWENKDVGAGGILGGFDFDGDGWPDIALTKAEALSERCGDQAMVNSWLELLQGKDGTLHKPVSKEVSICWRYPSATYPTWQWTDLSILFGAGTTTLSFQQYYAKQGYILRFRDGSFHQDSAFLYPSTPQFDRDYDNKAAKNAYGHKRSWTDFPHVANGMIVKVGDEERIVFFTSTRVVQYRTGPLNRQQLVFDTPFLTNHRRDLVGRNYGLIMPDPANSRYLTLVAGTAADTMFLDKKSGKMDSDYWGGIERHVTIYDLHTGRVQDRFFSYAHDNNDGFKYEGRVLFPNNIYPATRANRSRLAFNVYTNGHWNLVVTDPGSTETAKSFRDLFLWDIADVDQDGVQEWITSPVGDPSDADVPGYYFVKWRTELNTWDESTMTLTLKKRFDDAIPLLTPHFREPQRTSSHSYLYPVQTVERNGHLEILLWKSRGAMETQPL